MDAVNQTVLTPEGKARLEAELAEREGTRHAEIIAEIQKARGFGDLSENSEYDAALAAQAENDGRIAELHQILATAVVSEAAGDTVSINSTVEVEDDRGRTSTYRIVGTSETNSLNHEISNESPAGSALVDAREGDTVEFTTPSGKVRHFKVLRILD